MTSPTSALARLVGDVDRFERRHWGRCPLLRRGEPGSWHDVWSVEAFDDLLSSAVRRPVVRLVVDGRPVPPERWTRRTRLGGRDLDDVVDPVAVAAELARGATVVGQSLHRTRTDVGRWVASLADEISHPVQANAYLTPPGATGLAPHADAHDVVVVQVAGRKSWHVDGLGDLELRDGDVLYVPAGTTHRATSLDEVSLHLTIGVLAVTRRAVVERALAAAPAELDRPLPLRYRAPGASIADDVASALDVAIEHLRGVDVARLEEAERGRALTRPPRHGALVDVVRSGELRGGSRIERRGATWALDERDGRVEVRADGRHVTAPAACRPAIERARDAGPIAIDDLPGLDAAGRVTLARRLVEEGFCRVVER